MKKILLFILALCLWHHGRRRDVACAGRPGSGLVMIMEIQEPVIPQTVISYFAGYACLSIYSS